MTFPEKNMPRFVWMLVLAMASPVAAAAVVAGVGVLVTRVEAGGESVAPAVVRAEEEAAAI